MWNKTYNMTISQFNSFALANRFAAGMTAQAVMLGDNGKFWVVTLADAAKLERMGFEWAN